MSSTLHISILTIGRTRRHLADSPEVVQHLFGPPVDPRGAPPGAVEPVDVRAAVVPRALVAEGEDALRLAALAIPTGAGTVSGEVQRV